MKDLICTGLYLPTILYAVISDGTFSVFILSLVSLFMLFNLIKTKCIIKDIRNSEIPELLKKQKEDFTDSLTHDLKVPTMAQLRGIELLYNEMLGSVNDEQKSLLLQVADSCKYVLEMISMLRNTYKIDSGNYKLFMQTFNLSEVIIKCFENLQHLCDQKNLKMIYTPSDDVITVEADKTEIYKVVFNMLYSAINYSKYGGRISVKTYTDENRIIFSASGMELNIDENYSTVGHGIGMYISKKIIELHHGKIFIPQGGNLSNTFTFVLPKHGKVGLKTPN